MSSDANNNIRIKTIVAVISLGQLCVQFGELAYHHPKCRFWQSCAHGLKGWRTTTQMLIFGEDDSQSPQNFVVQHCALRRPWEIDSSQTPQNGRFRFA